MLALHLRGAGMSRPTETIMLPIPITWIESITYDRDGCRIWIGGGDPEELEVNPPTAEKIRAAIARRE